MNGNNVLSIMFHFITIGLFVVLFLLVNKMDNFQSSWYKEDMETYNSLEQTVNRIDKRLYLDGCILNSKK